MLSMQLLALLVTSIGAFTKDLQVYVCHAVAFEGWNLMS